MARFHQLRVAAVDRLTDDSVALTFEVPESLREEFRHAPGQHLALRRPADDGEIRRTYSICSPAPGPEGPGPSASASASSKAAPSRRTPSRRSPSATPLRS